MRKTNIKIPKNFEEIPILPISSHYNNLEHEIDYKMPENYQGDFDDAIKLFDNVKDYYKNFIVEDTTPIETIKVVHLYKDLFPNVCK